MAKDRLQGKKTLQVAGFLDDLTKTDIKKDIDIVQLFNHFGVKLTKKGKSYMGLCPWHEDTNPSLSVDREDGIYHCFGCGKKGDIFTLTEKMKGLDFKGATAFLREYKGQLTTSFRTGQTTQSGQTSKLPDRDEAGVIGEEISTTEDKPFDSAQDRPTSEEQSQAFTESITLTTITYYYHKQLQTNEKARKYLEQRGLSSVELVTRFKLGFADGTIQDKISDKQKAELKVKGILNKYDKEHFLNCITFPVIDDLDQTVGIYGRSIQDKSKVPHLYLKGDHKGVFNRKASKVYDEIILTESIIDCLSLITLGFENTQSIYGTNGFTTEHLQTLKNDRVKTIIIAFDADEAGNTATEKIKEQLVSEGFSVKVIYPLNTCKDWNEYLVSGGDVKLIKEQIEQAEIYKSKQQTSLFSVTKDTLGHIFTIGEIVYRVSGVKDMFVNNLRVNIKATILDMDFKYYDNLDLYSARSRNTFSQNLSRDLDVEQKQVDKDLISILEYLEKERDRALFSKNDTPQEIEMTGEEIELGMEFLQNPHMFDQVIKDMEVLGYIGEERNKVLLYIVANSYLLDDPFSVIVTSQSASGKSALIETVEEMVPPERLLTISSFSDYALNYAKDIDRKFMTVSEMMHKTEIEYQLRDIQTKHKLTRFLTKKDMRTGELESKAVETQAYTAIAMTTTDTNINQENASRCFIVKVDESAEQTARILRKQRKKFKLEGQEEKIREVPVVLKRHQSAGRLLKAYTVIIPYVDQVRFPERFLRARRDYLRFLYLIAAVCHLRQKQKEVKQSNNVSYIEADVRDYEIAYDQLIHNNLLTNLTELPQGTEELYESLRKLSRKMGKHSTLEAHEVSITQRDIREYTGFNQMWVKRHLRTLVDYEYVRIVQGGRTRSKGYYRIVADEPIGNIDVTGIIRPEELRDKLDK